MKTAFITGITGQDGAYLAKLLLDKGYKVLGGVRRSASQEFFRLHYLDIYDRVTLINLEMQDGNNIARIFKNNTIDEFYNLAAHSFVGSSWDNPTYVAEVNAIAVSYILDAIRTYSPTTRFYQASTSEMYGKVRETPQSELTPFYPRSPYGVAKSFAHYLTVNYRESYNLHTSCGILFNHESPLRGNEFVTKKIVRNLVQQANREPVVLELGNLYAERDWGYAADYVEGMWRMLQQPQGDDYVLATGKTTTIKQFVEYVASTLNMPLTWSDSGLNEIATSRGRLVLRINPEFYRPAEVDLLLGDPTKAQQKLGWSATETVESLAKIMVDAELKMRL